MKKAEEQAGEIERLRKSVSRLSYENDSLRYLCLMRVPELEKSQMFPGERPCRRLDYLLGTISADSIRDMLSSGQLR